MGHLGQRQRQPPAWAIPRTSSTPTVWTNRSRTPAATTATSSRSLPVQLRTTFDPAERAKIAVEMQQQLLDDNSYVFCSFLRMSMIMKANVSGLEAHTCDFYELTADLDIQ